MSDIFKDTEKTVFKVTSLAGCLLGGVPTAVDVKNGKIVRLRPLHLDSKYNADGINTWKFERNGKTLKPILKSLPSPWSLAYKKRAYSPNRIKYPLKRVDWDPNGERNTQNRGKSKFKRISWDEAASIVANEIKRIHKEYGSYGIMVQADGHAECKTVHISHGCEVLLLDKMGGFTQQIRNPDSWEGWYWGTEHVWGIGEGQTVGLMHPPTNVIKDVTENSDMVLVWGGDPETTVWGFTGQNASSILYFWSQIGIKQVYVCPDLNYAAAVHADKWIPVLPNTDMALQLAIAYVWITEGTYDKEYVATHTVGFDKVNDYVMGKEDGVPKTPAWASSKCGVPEWTIKALARQFASQTTSIVHNFGGPMIRGPYAHEPARMEAILLGMQGLGKPGVHQCNFAVNTGRGNAPKEAQSFGAPPREHPEDDRITRPRSHSNSSISKQGIPKTLIQEAIFNPPITFWGNGAIMQPPEDQFKKYTYPIPKEEGGTEIHMMWCDNPCRFTCWNDGMKTAEAYRSPKIECIVVQHPWLENDTLFADIILPANTTFEVEDIVLNLTLEVPNVTLQRQAIQPIGESKSDYEIVLEVAGKLGLYDKVSGGKTVEEWIKHVYNRIGLSNSISWEDFNQKGYYVYSLAPDWDKKPAGMYKFYKDPEANPLPTPSGKLEFYSERIAKVFPDDKERPPIPKWIEKSITHDERLSSDRAREYPLLLMSNHGRWRVHAQCDDISWTRECPTCKVKGPDSYLYEPLWIHPSEAAKRGIKSGDIVKVYNERGVVLGGAYVTERLMSRVAYMDHGARVDWIIPGKLDRGGAINLIAPIGITSKNCVGHTVSGYLVEVEKVSLAQMEEWKQQYPEAFSREYDPASGLRFDAWIEGSSK
jgi:molybdopterin guanine dinucleotide-containing S/N-oxide reductase-like protein